MKINPKEVKNIKKYIIKQCFIKLVANSENSWSTAVGGASEFEAYQDPQIDNMDHGGRSSSRSQLPPARK